MRATRGEIRGIRSPRTFRSGLRSIRRAVARRARDGRPRATTAGRAGLIHFLREDVTRRGDGGKVVRGKGGQRRCLCHGCDGGRRRRGFRPDRKNGIELAAGRSHVALREAFLASLERGCDFPTFLRHLPARVFDPRDGFRVVDVDQENAGPDLDRLLFVPGVPRLVPSPEEYLDLLRGRESAGGGEPGVRREGALRKSGELRVGESGPERETRLVGSRVRRQVGKGTVEGQRIEGELFEIAGCGRVYSRRFTALGKERRGGRRLNRCRVPAGRNGASGLARWRDLSGHPRGWGSRAGRDHGLQLGQIDCRLRVLRLLLQFSRGREARIHLEDEIAPDQAVVDFSVAVQIERVTEGRKNLLPNLDR
jgi:hypothetical protein